MLLSSSKTKRRARRASEDRVKIVITDAEWRKAERSRQIKALVQNLRTFVPSAPTRPQIPVDDDVRAMMSVLSGDRRAEIAAERAAEPEVKLRNALKTSHDEARLVEQDKPAARLQLAGQLMNAALLFVAFPVGMVLALNSVLRGGDLRLTAHATTLTGVYLAIHNMVAAGIFA